MKILKVKAKNFGPYGTEGLELDFTGDDYSLNLLVGKNGTGKSTCKDIIEFGLFGKVNNKKLKSLSNRINKKTEVYIELIANQKHIVIRRGIEPSIFEVSIDGDSDFGDQAGKLDVQKKLEEEIFGIPYHIFNNIISLSVNDFKSFIKMTPKDKRTIIDKIFGLGIVNRMSEELKVDIRNIKESITKVSIRVNFLNNELDTRLSQLEEMTNKLMEKKENRKDEILSYIKESESIKAKLSENLSELSSLKLENNGIIEDLGLNIGNKKYALKKVTEKIVLFSKEKCPTCGANFKTADYKKMGDSLLEESKKLEKEIIDEEKVLDSLVLEKNNITDKYIDIKLKLENIESENRHLLKELKSLDGDSDINNQLLSIKNIIENFENQLIEAKEDSIKEDKKKKFYDIIESILSDSGVKQTILSNIIPNINLQLKESIRKLDLNFQLEFDDKFDAVISHYGEIIEPSTLSTGENKKLDFVVIIAIIRLMKLKFPGLNLLFLDEVFSSLDSDSVHSVLTILSDLSKKLGLHIFVVNHAPLDNNLFDYLYRVERINQFSRLKKEIVE